MGDDQVPWQGEDGAVITRGAFNWVAPSSGASDSFVPGAFAKPAMDMSDLVAFQDVYDEGREYRRVTWQRPI